MIFKIGEWFQEASISLEEALQSEVKRVETCARKRGIAEVERAQSLVRSLQDKAERMGPVYRFSMVMDGNINVYGYVRPGVITFFYHAEPSDESDQMIMHFLSSLNMGAVERVKT